MGDAFQDRGLSHDVKYGAGSGASDENSAMDIDIPKGRRAARHLHHPYSRRTHRGDAHGLNAINLDVELLDAGIIHRYEAAL